MNRITPPFLVVLVAASALAACGSDSTATDSAQAKADAIVAQAEAKAAQIKEDATAATTDDVAADTTVAESTDDTSDDATSDRLPDMVGKGLQFAQDAAQDAGFYSLKSHDALGRGRLQVLDRNWKVCSQTPSPGTTDTSSAAFTGVRPSS